MTHKKSILEHVDATITLQNGEILNIEKRIKNENKQLKSVTVNTN